MSCYRELREAVEKVAIVDAHAHNLVPIDSDYPFLRCFSEGGILADTPHTLSFKRGIKDIASLYDCNPTLDDVEKYRKSAGLQSIAARCFAAANIAAVFVDDGVEFDKMHGSECDSRRYPAVGNILTIETFAEKILNETANGLKYTLEAFSELFMSKLKSAADKVVALKTIAAHQIGLEINTQVSKRAAQEGLLEDFNGGKPIKIRNKNLLDHLFTCSLAVAIQFNLPMQIHTGFGDKDLDLSKYNPLLLRGLLEDERYSKCRFVLLHGSYPFCKEASYLSSAYSQVYLDLGLAVPKLSVHGMISSVKELLELAPINKVIFSSGGAAFPETFYLGAKRARRVIYSVLSDVCDDGDLTVVEAIDVIERIFRNNALELYDFHNSIGSIDPEGSLTTSTVGKTQEDDTIFVRIIWVDNSGQHRCRVIPSKRFSKVMKTGVGMTVASMAMSSHRDGPEEGSNLNILGEVRLVPDLSSKMTIRWTNQEEMVLANMQVNSGEAWEYCPRNTLRRVLQLLKEEFNLGVSTGFEIEFYLLKKASREIKDWISSDTTLHCSSSGFDSASSVMKEIMSSLDSTGIMVEQLHAEGGHGQFEIVLAHTDCNLAADNIIFAREVIRAVSRKHNLLATFLPKYFLNDSGSGCHAHLSLWRDGKNVFMGSDNLETPYGISKIGENFMAGVFHHLPSLLAIIAPLPNSYDRIQPNKCCGAYQCWGTQKNREITMRIACHPGLSGDVASNFEVKPFDGCANPHIGLASIVAAGIDGLRRNLTLPPPTDVKLVNFPPNVRRLPKDLGESVVAFEGDTVLHGILGKNLAEAIIGVRKAEIDYYAANGRSIEQLIHKY